ITVIAKDIFNAETGESLFIIVGDPQFSDLIYINFDQSSGAGDPWNNTSGLNGIDDLKNVNGDSSGLSLAFSGWTSSLDSGVNHPQNNGVYPNSVISSRWKAEGESSITFTGLDEDMFYNLIV